MADFHIVPKTRKAVLRSVEVTPELKFWIMVALVSALLLLLVLLVNH